MTPEWSRPGQERPRRGQRRPRRGPGRPRPGEGRPRPGQGRREGAAASPGVRPRLLQLVLYQQVLWLTLYTAGEVYIFSVIKMTVGQGEPRLTF